MCVCSCVTNLCYRGTWKIIFYTTPWLVFAGWLLHVIGLSTPDWSLNNNNSNQTMGLWVKCNPNCNSYDMPALVTIRALAMLALLASFIGMILLSVTACWLYGEDERSPGTGMRLLYIAIGPVIFSGLFMLISVILWRNNIHDGLKGDWSIGPGFNLSLCGGIIMPLSMLVGYCSRVSVHNADSGFDNLS